MTSRLGFLRRRTVVGTTSRTSVAYRLAVNKVSPVCLGSLLYCTYEVVPVRLAAPPEEYSITAGWRSLLDDTFVYYCMPGHWQSV